MRFEGGSRRITAPEDFGSFFCQIVTQGSGRAADRQLEETDCVYPPLALERHRLTG